MSERIDEVKKGLMNLVKDDKIPECLVQSFLISSIMAMQFEPFKMGEIFSNIANNINKIFNIYEYKAEIFTEDVKNLYIELSKQIYGDTQKNLQKQENNDKK